MALLTRVAALSCVLGLAALASTIPPQPPRDGAEHYEPPTRLLGNDITTLGRVCTDSVNHREALFEVKYRLGYRFVRHSTDKQYWISMDGSEPTSATDADIVLPDSIWNKDCLPQSARS